ncbi:hypothetical protein Anacy_3505 [Anabaena cylindrica PCC 7122]|uniref:Uncharacterized protein n=1 Tax=Anabaena cylindrica (strain ATCC 27899 / PCC 7122) TaxID=272123 RepID=K9ZK31_ANACC|nr:hypothetical protein Anacy_3505 [Anabaena cylindrica PCC 7122]BAY04081.1 hypothetical protein NIES19_33420 [Anabaena cylindrica PCC 7122]
MHLENSTKKMIQSCGMGILPVLILLAGKMPAPQEILGYFFNWRTPRELHKKDDPILWDGYPEFLCTISWQDLY